MQAQLCGAVGSRNTIEIAAVAGIRVVGLAIGLVLRGVVGLAVHVRGWSRGVRHVRTVAISCGRCCVVVAAAAGGGVAVGLAVGGVVGGVVCRAVSIEACGGRSNRGRSASRDGISSQFNRRHHSNDESDSEDDNSDIECNTDACIVLLRRSFNPQGQEGQDEGGDGERETDERRATHDQRAYGKHESAQCNPRVVLHGRRQASGRRRRWLCRNHNGCVGEWR